MPLKLDKKTNFPGAVKPENSIA